MKNLLKKIILGILPNKSHLNLIYFYLKITKRLDPEMLYVSRLLKSRRRFLDIGANIGIYSFHFKNIFKNINSFEPLMAITYRLEAIKSSFLEVHNVALSNKKGEYKFYIPYINNKLTSALASLEKKDGTYKEKIVRVNTIDSYSFTDVDLIKIDVEGHEQSVIFGAYETIKKCMPILLVEIEQRHINIDINKVFKTILDLDYSGYFLDERGFNLVSLKEFDYELHQKPFLANVMSRKYVNNFIFIPNIKN